MLSYLKILFLFVTASLFGVSQQDLPEPYKSAQLYDFNPHGFLWCEENAIALKALVEKNNVKTIIEVGSWLGSSTRLFATLIPEEGKVYAVDHWLGSEEHQPGELFWNPVLPILYDQFLSNVIHAGLTHKIVPVRMNSLEAAKTLTHVVPDLIYIDASHDFDSVYADLEAWFPYVKGHGILCGDDWQYISVRSAVYTFIGKYGLEVEALSVGCWRIIE